MKTEIQQRDSENQVEETEELEPVEGQESDTDQDEGAEEQAPQRDQRQQQDNQRRGGNLQAALKEERERRKTSDRELKELRDKQIKIDARLKALFEQPEEKGPTFEENPAEFLRKQNEEVAAKADKVSRFIEQNQAVQEVGSYASQSVSAFKQQEGISDYEDAYSFIREQRIGEIKAIYDCTDADAIQRVNAEEFNFTIECLQKERNPAKSLYAYAKQRGYKPGASEGEERIDRIQRGMNGSKSLSQSSGKNANGLTAESLLAMTDEEFSEFKRKHPTKFRELMGG
jgi:hypothetical protein